MSKNALTPVRLTISLSKEHDKILQAAAKKKSLPKSIFVRTILADWAIKDAERKALDGGIGA